MNVLEKMAIAMWQKEVEDYYALRLHRTEITWFDQSDDTQNKWKRYAEAAWEVVVEEENKEFLGLCDD